MIDKSVTRIWIMRSTFVLLALTILFFNLLPLQTTPRTWAGPDLLLGFAFAWVLRRPDYVPPLLLAGIFLLSDLLLQRPPGLWSLLALLGCENLKGRIRNLRDSTFAAEWLAVAVVTTMVLMGNRLILAIVMVPVPSLTLSLSELGATLLSYPLIVLVTHGVLGVRRPTTTDLDSMGYRA